MDAFEDICISDVTVLSGVRPAGRNTNLLDSERGRGRHGLLYIWDGEAVFTRQDGRQITVKNGDLLYIPKGHRYRMEYTAPSTTFVLANMEIFHKNGDTAPLSRDLAVLVRDDASNRIAAIMVKLEMCSGSQGYTAVFRRKELVYKLLGAVYENSSVPSLTYQGYPQIFAGVLLLEQSYLENLPVSQYAEACNISVSLFRSLFGKQYGMSPVQYRNRLRIDRAAAMLAEGSCTVAEAAYASGFDNIGYFCRYYKKITGETPRETKEKNF